MTLTSTSPSIFDQIGRLGLRGILAYKLKHRYYYLLSKLGIRLQDKIFYLSTKKSKLPLHCRFETSDRDVFYQIFVEEEYSCIDHIKTAKLIVDCGANVGYSSAYFLNQYPNAHVIAVEPDQGNFEILRRNLAAYAKRSSLICSGIWSHQTGLVISKGEFRDGRDWSIQVRACQDNETADLLAIDLGTLLEESEFDSIDILKIDIESAETVVFSQNYEKWLRKVKNIVIELHGEECEAIFFKAMSPYKYDLYTSGELTVCRNITLRE